MSEECKFLYDVSMSYVNPGWQERYCQLVRHLDEQLKEKCGEFFADLYYDVPGVLEALPEILQFVNRQYRETVGHNVRRKQILKFDLAKKLHGQSMACLKACEDTDISEEVKAEEDDSKPAVNPAIEEEQESVGGEVFTASDVTD